MRHERVRACRGFTLLEVLVALALGGVVILLAHRLFVGVVDGTRQLAAARMALDREANARRWLVEALGSLDVGPGDRGGPFAGRVDRLEFGTWLLVADGWHARQRVELGRDDDAFVALIEGERLVLAERVTALAFDYLLEPGADTKWVREWLSPASAPVAVRIRIAIAAAEGQAERVDTLLLHIGPRG